jgi:uncharacterized surface protein with fasciclin (FAS1) repeats
MILLLLLIVAELSHGFQLSTKPFSSRSYTRLRSSLDSVLGGNEDLLLVKKHLQGNYPALNQLFNLNDSIWKALGEGDGFTIFAPNAAAFEQLGEAKQGQLLDERNLETTQKIAAYHVIAERVTSDNLYNSGGVITLGGEIPVDRSVSGGMFGVGGKEDGGVLVNEAKIIQSVEIGSGVLHEMEGLVSPNILWRYMDQLRIPGSN